MKEIVKSILGPSGMKAVRPFGHGAKGLLASIWYGFPATKLKIIAITGTKGKTSTTVTTGRLLNALGKKVGYISTALISDGQNEFINSTKMSSVDGIYMQKLLKRMVKNGCEYLVIEMSSQGLEQNRQVGLFGFDLAMFLNIYPEHIEAHGSFEKYRDSKGLIFKKLKENGIVVITGNEEFKESVEIYKKDFIKTSSRIFEINNQNFKSISNPQSQFKSIEINKNTYSTNFLADFEIENLAFAITAIEKITGDKTLDSKLASAIISLKNVPGRLDYVVKNNIIISNEESKDYKSQIDIMVDYAHETGSMEKLLITANDWKRQGIYDKIIHIVSCDGVGRDDWKKPILGDLSQKLADFSYVTTDNYGPSDDPNQILALITQNFNSQNLDKTYSMYIDRKEAMIQAYFRAQKYKGEKVLIVSTGVGTEQYLTQPSGMLKWDEKLIWEMIFKNY